MFLAYLKRVKPCYLNENLAVMSLIKIPLFTYSYPSCILRINNAINTARIKKTVNKLKMDENFLLYHWNWMFADLIGKCGEKANIYHCRDAHDKHMHFKNSRYGKYILSNEKRLYEKGVVKTYVLSETMRNEIIKRYDTTNVEVSPSGVDYDYFRKRIEESAVHSHPFLDNIAKPRILYCGGINERLDMNLIYRLAENNKNWNFIFYGGASISVKRDYDNVYFPGSVSASEVPVIMSKCDVGIMNYVKSDFTDFIDPLKMTEYMAAELPVVSSPISAALDFNAKNLDLLLIADKYDEWEDQIKKAVSLREDLKYRKKLLETAEKYSIENKMKKILNFIETL